MSRKTDGSAGHLVQDDTVQFGSPRPPRHWPRWLLLVPAVAAVAVVATVIVVAVGRHPRKPSAHGVTEVGHRLLGVRAGWELLGQGPGVVVRIEPARGRVTRTAVPVLQSTGPVSFVAGAGQVIIRPLDAVPGYLVPDGRPARPLTGARGRGGYVFPGPQPGQLWVQAGSGRHASMLLIGRNGGSTGVSVPVPAVPWPLSSDGSGYLLVGDSHGVYDARPGSLRRVTTGTVVAEGPTGWLAAQCRRGQHCSEVVINSASGARRVISRSRTAAEELIRAYAPPGVISPDGSTAAVFQGGAAGQTSTLHLINLRSGADQPLAVPADEAMLDLDSAAWSPDSRWLFVAAGGKLLAVDARTRRVHDLGVALPKIYQVAIGTGSS